MAKFFEEAKRVGLELMTYYIKIDKKEKVYLNMPLIFVVLFFALVNLDTKIWVLVVSIGMVLISESQVSIFKEEKGKEDDMTMSVKKTAMDKEKDNETNNIIDSVSSESSSDHSNKDDDDDDDYYEITIEK